MRLKKFLGVTTTQEMTIGDFILSILSAFAPILFMALVIYLLTSS